MYKLHARTSNPPIGDGTDQREVIRAHILVTSIRPSSIAHVHLQPIQQPNVHPDPLATFLPTNLYQLSNRLPRAPTRVLLNACCACAGPRCFPARFVVIGHVLCPRPAEGHFVNTGCKLYKPGTVLCILNSKQSDLVSYFGIIRWYDL